MHDSPPSARRLAPDAPAVGALVARAREGDREAQQELFFRHVSLVTGLIARLRPSRHDLDDLVQDTFIAAFQSIGRLSDPEAFAPWVGAIAVRTTLKHLRRHRLAARAALAARCRSHAAMRRAAAAFAGPAGAGRRPGSRAAGTGARPLARRGQPSARRPRRSAPAAAAAASALRQCFPC